MNTTEKIERLQAMAQKVAWLSAPPLKSPDLLHSLANQLASELLSLVDEAHQREEQEAKDLARMYQEHLLRTPHV